MSHEETPLAPKKKSSYDGMAVKDYVIDIQPPENFFEERKYLASSGSQLTPFVFKDSQICRFFPGGVNFLNPRDNKKSVKSKIDDILMSDNQVALYIDVTGNDLNCIILGNSHKAVVINTYAYKYKGNTLKKTMLRLLSDYNYKKVFYNVRFLETTFKKYFEVDKLVRIFNINHYRVLSTITKYVILTTLQDCKMGLVCICQVLLLEF